MSEQIWVGTRKGLAQIRRGRRGNADWSVADMSLLGKPVTQLLEAKNGRLYAALNEGHFGPKLHASADSGKTWTEIALPEYPKSDAEDAPALVQIWALEAADPDDPNALWAGTIPGGLFYSADGGKSWSLNDALWNNKERARWFGGGYDQPGIHSIAVDPRSKNRIAIAVSCGGVWLSEDGGASWTVHCDGMTADYLPPDQAGDPAMQDPHLLRQCRGNPQTYWVQHHNGIFVSDDDLKSWRRIESAGPSTFGFAVAVHPADPKTAWFAPAQKDEARYPMDGRFVVTRTRDGGHTFEVLDDGLPKGAAWDLVYRHCLAVDATGERLAMATTTGNLWVSENGGDRWTHVTAHLPPVYCVSFGT